MNHSRPSKARISSDHITIRADLETAIDAIGKEFESLGFVSHFLTERSVEYARDFQFVKPLRITGIVELSFFQYGEDLVIHYKIRRIVGASNLLLLPLTLYMTIFLTKLFGNGLNIDPKVYVPTFVLLVGFFLLRWYKYYWLKKVTLTAMSRFSPPDA